MSETKKLLPISWPDKFRSDLSLLSPYLLALDREERRIASDNKKSIIEKYKTLSWPHLNYSLFCDLVELKLANDLTGDERPLFVSILGGSKTGKSFVFNHLLKKQLAPSGVGVTTHSVLLYFHRRWSWKNLKNRYFPRPAPGLSALDNKESLCDSLIHRIYYLEHKNDEIADFVLIDTPDFNREDDENVRLAYMALAISDVVLYVFTGDTYADAGGATVARIANECGKTIIPVYNMVDESLLKQPSELIEDYRKKTKTPQEHGDGTNTPPPYPFFPDNFFAVSWIDLRHNPKAEAHIEPVNFASGNTCQQILANQAQNKQFKVLPQTLTKATKLLDSVTPDLENVFKNLDRIEKDLSMLSESVEVEFPLPEAARAIYEVMEGFRPEVVNRFLSGLDKVHEKTIRLAFEWVRKKIARDSLTEKSTEDLSGKRLHQESRRIVEKCVSFADSIHHSGCEYGIFLFETLKLSQLNSQREALESRVYKAFQKDDALAEVKQEMSADMAKNPARGFLVYSDVAVRISAVAGAILLTGDGVWMDHLLWGTLGEVIGQPLAKIFIGRVGGTRLLERYKIRRRQRYQQIIEEIVLHETLAVLQNLPDRDSFQMIRQMLSEIGSVQSENYINK